MLHESEVYRTELILLCLVQSRYCIYMDMSDQMSDIYVLFLYARWSGYKNVACDTMLPGVSSASNRPC